MVTVSVKNFQSLKNASLEVKGFTAITGPNNSGKSALMRAVRGVFENTPGTSFVRHGTEESEVTVTFAEGSVKWKKGTLAKTKPTYIINGGDPIFPGKEIPEQVRDFKVFPVTIGGQDVWPTLAPQFTGQVFLLDKPGSHLAEAVSNVEKVSKLNHALKKSESEKRAVTSEVKLRRKDLSFVEGTLNAFKDFTQIEERYNSLVKTHSQGVRIQQTIAKVLDYQVHLERKKMVERNLRPALSLSVPETSLCEKVKAQEDFCQNLHSRAVRMRELGEKLSPVAALQAPSLEETLSIYSSLSQAISFRDRLVSLRQKSQVSLPLLVGIPKDLDIDILDRAVLLQGKYHNLTRIVSEMDEIQAEVASIQEAIAGMPLCPTCGSLMGADQCP